MLNFRHVSVENVYYNWFGHKQLSPILSDINLSLERGEITALVGGSGEGKSLLLQSALALLPENLRMSGEIRLEGKLLNLEQCKKLRGNTLCYVPQGVSSLNPLLKVGTQLKRSLQLSGKHSCVLALEQQIKHFQLQTDILLKYPKQLSGGMAKRVLACNAALGGAHYILADEITAWLDEPLACQLLQQLRDLSAQGAGVLWVTHDLSLAARYADRIVALNGGRISDDISISELKNGGGSVTLRRHWLALPEYYSLFPDESLSGCAGST
ncbi:ATP-binding cassette domain-containing protein [Serratia sp. UGAL515B_01]|uniref:ATP-binding cassette domain-containing protein n=1 Tax=Serratia sp. UGAL515B_01 TaxID=2986763 RepID=UPI002954EEB4|nr:ATP-binding cassette domain-containing protein [Serratia sp. UGAL515B_01]WON76271.1 ATP-binding cassette domain-containing protein [Serratia sp. UGAL515B_01]